MTHDIDAVNVPAYFISSHEGFHGSIKNLIKDFVVTEIDINGERVTAVAACEKPAWNCCDADTDSKDSSPRWVAEVADPSADCGADVTTGSFDLSMILGQSVSEELEQFVLTLRDEKQSTQELSLGCFTDKHHRANVHRAVRHRFPFLMTITIQPEIRVREDPDYRELSQLVTEDEAEDFFRFIDAKVRGSSYMFGPDDNKEHRTAVHHFMNRRFGKLVETKSFSDQGRTAISVRLREQGRPKKRSADERREEDVYTAFTLCKENLETLEAISYMAAELGVLPSDFTYAGIKDKRAITYQSMVVKKVSPQRLEEKSAEFEKRGMRLSQIHSVGEPLRLGRLQGNHFDLVVRDLRPHRAGEAHPPLAALIKEAVENVERFCQLLRTAEVWQRAERAVGPRGLGPAQRGLCGCRASLLHAGGRPRSSQPRQETLPPDRERQGVSGNDAVLQTKGATHAPRLESLRHRSGRMRSSLAQPASQHQSLLPSRLLQQGVERGGSTQADHSGPQRQKRGPCVETGGVSNTGGHGRKQHASDPCGDRPRGARRSVQSGTSVATNARKHREVP
eukprot:XP_011611726.1 PREDICTED: pseudouridylate synthase 7 homolog-like protein isoform X2 [Takifugu rubripes]